MFSKILRNIFFVCLFLGFKPSFLLEVQSQGFKKITMQEAVEAGLANNPEMANASLEMEFESGSFFTKAFCPGYVKSNVELHKLKYKLEKNRISAEIKTCYVNWVFMHHQLNLLFEEKNCYADLTRISKLQYKTGEIDVLEKITAKASSAEKTLYYEQVQNEISIAENKLKQKTFLEGDLVPETEELRIYEISKPKKDKNDTLNTTLKYHKQKIVVQLKHDRKAKTKREIAQNNFALQQKAVGLDMENLKIELASYFNQIVYFKEYGLEQANLLIETAHLRYEKEDIDYFEFLQNIRAAFKIKLDYVEAIKKYNETAIKLEYYVN